MRFLVSLLPLLVISAVQQVPVMATVFSYSMGASESPCFHSWIDAIGQKIAFYFAVQSGGNFDVDYTVKDPNSAVIASGRGERQGDYVFTATAVGEHSFCFSNDGSSREDKLIDIDIMVENDKNSVKANLPNEGKKEGKENIHEPLEDSLYRLSADLASLSRQQKYFRTRENRNFATVESTESRIFWFSVLEVILIVSMAALQVFVVKTFFQHTKMRV